MVKEEHAGKRAKCPKCGELIQIPKRGKKAPAAERQKEYARQLGIEFDEDIDRREIRSLIDAAINKQDGEHYKRLEELLNKESAAYRELREKILAEIEEGLLSKATAAQRIRPHFRLTARPLFRRSPTARFGYGMHTRASCCALSKATATG